MVFMRILGLLVLAIVIVLAAYLVVLRPRSHRWGATNAELRRSLPGDDLVPTVKVGYTQAITINVPPEEVWPWLVQIGYQRGGWYTYDWFYKLMGEDDFYDGDRSADRIIPELQDLNVGDTINISKQMPFDVVALEQNRSWCYSRVLIWILESTLNLRTPCRPTSSTIVGCISWKR